MPRAEVVWNGEAKSYRVANELFVQGRARTEDWPESLYNYLKVTKGFTVVDKKFAPTPEKTKAAKEAATVEPEPAAPDASATIPLDGGGDDEESPAATRGPRRRR